MLDDLVLADHDGAAVVRLRNPCGARSVKLTPEERFWPKVDRRGGDECWPWKASKFRSGHGQFRGGFTAQAHVFSFRLHGGVTKDGEFVDHKRRNPPCVNPRHLQAATRKQNGENQRLSRRNTSGYRGVYRDRNKWRAVARHEGKLYSAGGFASKEDANRAAIDLRNSLFDNNLADRGGEFSEGYAQA